VPLLPLSYPVPTGLPLQKGLPALIHISCGFSDILTMACFSELQWGKPVTCLLSPVSTCPFPSNTTTSLHPQGLWTCQTSHKAFCLLSFPGTGLW
jgi:hypothetical protein